MLNLPMKLPVLFPAWLWFMTLLMMCWRCQKIMRRQQRLLSHGLLLNGLPLTPNSLSLSPLRCLRSMVRSILMIFLRQVMPGVVPISLCMHCAWAKCVSPVVTRRWPSGAKQVIRLPLLVMLLVPVLHVNQPVTLFCGILARIFRLYLINVVPG